MADKELFSIEAPGEAGSAWPAENRSIILERLELLVEYDLILARLLDHIGVSQFKLDVWNYNPAFRISSEESEQVQKLIAKLVSLVEAKMEVTDPFTDNELWQRLDRAQGDLDGFGLLSRGPEFEAAVGLEDLLAVASCNQLDLEHFDELLQDDPAWFVFERDMLKVLNNKFTIWRADLKDQLERKASNEHLKFAIDFANGDNSAVIDHRIVSGSVWERPLVEFVEANPEQVKLLLGEGWASIDDLRKEQSSLRGRWQAQLAEMGPRIGEVIGRAALHRRKGLELDDDELADAYETGSFLQKPVQIGAICEARMAIRTLILAVHHKLDPTHVARINVGLAFIDRLHLSNELMDELDEPVVDWLVENNAAKVSSKTARPRQRFIDHLSVSQMKKGKSLNERRGPDRVVFDNFLYRIDKYAAKRAKVDPNMFSMLRPIVLTIMLDELATLTGEEYEVDGEVYEIKGSNPFDLPNPIKDAMRLVGPSRAVK